MRFAEHGLLCRSRIVSRVGGTRAQSRCRKKARIVGSQQRLAEAGKEEIAVSKTMIDTHVILIHIQDARRIEQVIVGYPGKVWIWIQIHQIPTRIVEARTWNLVPSECITDCAATHNSRGGRIVKGKRQCGKIALFEGRSR